MYAPVHECRDSLTGIALVLEAMAVSGRSLGELADTVPPAVMKKAKTELSAGVSVESTLAAVEQAFADKHPRVNRDDGVLLEWGAGDALSWIHARASNTEPILRYMAEASVEEETDAILARALDAARS